jgi:pimeloyl-ACP methyl ester carboxylesterase
MKLEILVLAFLLVCGIHVRGDDLGEEGYANSGGVKIHFVTAGKGPLVVMIHGFPDFWYSWRHQIPALAKHFQVVAIDMRGYNKSDQPLGVENYTMDKLVGDVLAVIDHFKQDRAVIVGHDWGGAVAWSFAMKHPEKTDRLIICNLPHPNGLMRELAKESSEQHKNSEYARNFQKPDAATKLKPEMLVIFHKDANVRKRYLEALGRSSMEGMLNYYKANYPRPPYTANRELPKVKCPVLMLHGLKDQFLLPGALNDSWKWVEKDFTLVTIPEAGHFVQWDAPDVVTKNMVRWLTQ